MAKDPTKNILSMKPMEAVGIIGLGLHIGWLLLMLFWVFCFFPFEGAPLDHCLVQMQGFIGMALGFVLFQLLSRNVKFFPYSPVVIAAEIAGSVALPCLVLLNANGFSIPIALDCVVTFAGGVASSFITVCWLDVCSLLDTRMYGRFTGLSFLVGSLAFALTRFVIFPSDVVFGILYALASISLLKPASRIAEENPQKAPLDMLKKGWGFRKEVEPSFFMFGATFGMTFAWLFLSGPNAVFWGLLSVIPGALCIALLSIFRVRVNITMVLRIMLCICVFACVFMPQSNDTGRLLCSCLIIAVWAMFTALNYAFIIRKSAIMRDTPCFRQAASHLAVPACGLAVGWIVIFVGVALFGAGSTNFAVIRLSFAVLLVIVFTLFYPTQEHHSMDGDTRRASSQSVPLDDRELFDLRIKLIAEHYQLSLRETEIIRFLARGRNAGYIQERLVLSLNTVRSHIYNIYKKLDVHSQQAVIDLVETYPIDEKEKF